MKKLLFILIPIILLSGCVTQEACQEKFPCTTTNTTTEKIVVHDSLVFVPADSSLLQAYIWCSDNNQLLIDSVNILNSKKSNVSYHIVNNPNGKGKILTVDCKCDSMAIYLKLRDRYITKETNKTQILPDPETNFDRYLKKVIWLISILGGIFLIYVVYRVIKK